MVYCIPICNSATMALWSEMYLPLKIFISNLDIISVKIRFQSDASMMCWKHHMLLQSQGFHCVIKDLCIWVFCIIYVDIEITPY